MGGLIADSVPYRVGCTDSNCNNHDRKTYMEPSGTACVGGGKGNS